MTFSHRMQLDELGTNEMEPKTGGPYTQRTQSTINQPETQYASRQNRGTVTRKP